MVSGQAGGVTALGNGVAAESLRRRLDFDALPEQSEGCAGVQACAGGCCGAWLARERGGSG